MKRERTIAEELGAFLASVQFDDIPCDAVHAARRCLLDYCGSSLRGSLESPADMARAVSGRLMGGAGARQFPDGRQSSPGGAAFVNGVSGHIVELDDLHNPSTFHPGAPIIPAVLAAAEETTASGAEVLRAIVLGYEVGIRVAEAVNPTHYAYWHPTGTCGAFGAAAGVGTILGLSAEQHAHALGSAGTQAAGLWAFLTEGAMSKHLHAGRAAHNGLVAAYLAREGFTGARSIIESAQGFVAATTAGADPWSTVEGLGSDAFKILENGFKVHACCGHTHTAIDLAIEMGERVHADRIESARVGTYGAALAIAGIEDPTSGYEARFSLRYSTAHGLVRGIADLDAFRDEAIDDTAVRSMMSRIQIEIDPRIEDRYPEEWGCILDITTTDGERLTSSVAHPRGMPANPLSDTELMDKYLGLAELAIGRERATAIAERIWGLPDGDAISLFDVLDPVEATN